MKKTAIKTHRQAMNKTRKASTDLTVKSYLERMRKHLKLITEGDKRPELADMLIRHIAELEAYQAKQAKRKQEG